MNTPANDQPSEQATEADVLDMELFLDAARRIADKHDEAFRELAK